LRIKVTMYKCGDDYYAVTMDLPDQSFGDALDFPQARTKATAKKKAIVILQKAIAHIEKMSE